ncbi:MAG TPA: pyridoxal-dependent decarboxylase [Bacteroidales bacterium]|nr:aspartate aminotransferase family protein [Bacteroidales bacterium]HOU96701.1 pyridoxal-dependent decarboxylase [Bacteroidales bacterium]HQG37028.1 pyridoxal-dependent decarboxylase [Bacteroidales bacterium]HQG53098.1 pyridoxal-dependent decarboxylase [Bacteroidales bacterium]HQJ21123.1 pyridoxal-dependent decarboxylase [Bacteroidales bacterium]
MKSQDFRKYAHQLVDWMASYMDNVENYPVKSSVKPREIFNKLPDHPPLKAEPFEAFFNDFLEIIIPGITHWQSPNFYAYFPANTSPPSILAEMLTATLAVQCMIWETSPAATELEEKMMNWLRDIIGLPDYFEGVIQDTASTSTLAAILTAREKITRFKVNEDGAFTQKQLRVYCSDQAHSSVDKAVKIAGIGIKNLVKIDTRSDFSLDPEKLSVAIAEDIQKGYTPCCVVATLGTTGVTAIDPIKEIGEICSKYGLWLHVDAALGGTALILPEYKWMLDGKEYIDSFVFNPHKWMFTNFDCSAFFVREAGLLIRTFEILPEYLKTRTRGQVNDYRDWGVPLGRRFRALKLWCVIRMYGVEGLQNMVRTHIEIARKLYEMIYRERDFEILAPLTLNTVCFRYKPDKISDEEANSINEKLNHLLNDSGRIYLTHTKIGEKYCLRMVTAQTNVTMKHVEKAWNLIMNTARTMKV